MEFYLPTRDECQKITQNSDAFFCTTRRVEDQVVEMYDYRLASISDFVDNKAFELRGLTFIQRADHTWERNILLNKFFNINQTTMDDIVRLTRGSIEIYIGPKNTVEYRSHMSKLIKTTVETIEKRGWMYDDVKDKKIARIQNKEDGSIISFVLFANGKVRAKSKMSFDSEQAQMAQKIYDTDTNIQDIVNNSFNANCTVIFELVSPNNQIVLEYKETELRLLQIRFANGVYMPQPGNTAKRYNVPFAQDIYIIADGSLSPLDILLHKKETSQENTEGWVVTFEDSQMAKIKTNKYLSLHGLIGPDAFRENLLVKTIIDGNIDDVVSALVPGEKKDKIVAMTEKVDKYYNESVVDFIRLYDEFHNKYKKDRKRFAMEYAQKHPLFSAVMKAVHTQADEVENFAEKAVYQHIEKSTNSLGKAKDWLQSI